ncbi:MAG: ribonuclease HI family protein [Candidatus Omnitrophota bacterium]|nr:ribonuclease HI family protein [Candidatus Omnitrophota bacterium]
MKQLKIYIDGASQGNPGPSGVGVVICNAQGKVINKIQRYIGRATNNIAEYQALICGLTEALLLKASHLTVYTDSELVANQMNSKYKVKNAVLQQLYQEATHLSNDFKQVEIKHIPRSKNRLADVLAYNSLMQQQ